MHRNRACLRDIEASCRRALCHSSRAAFRTPNHVRRFEGIKCKLPKLQTPKACNLKPPSPEKLNPRSRPYGFFTGDYMEWRRRLRDRLTRRGAAVENCDDRYLERGNSAGAHAIRRQKRPPLKALSGSSFPLADAARLLIWARRSHFFPSGPLQETFVQTAPLLIVSW